MCSVHALMYRKRAVYIYINWWWCSTAFRSPGDFHFIGYVWMATYLLFHMSNRIQSFLVFFFLCCRRRRKCLSFVVRRVMMASNKRHSPMGICRLFIYHTWMSSYKWRKTSQHSVDIAVAMDFLVIPSTSLLSLLFVEELKVCRSN